MTTMISLFVMKLQFNHAHNHRHTEKWKKERKTWSGVSGVCERDKRSMCSTEFFYLKAPNGKK